MRKKNTKRAIATYAMVSALILSANALPIYAAGEWKETNGVWNYTNEGKVLTGWQEIDNNWYAFDETGAMKTGWIASAEHWYYLGASGIMQSDAWVNNPDGSKYYIKGTGVMAADYIKDGYELTSDGKAVALADSKSVVLTDTSDLEGTTIEGNLYVDATLAKELLITGVTVTGKLVLLGDNKTQTKLTITDSNINTISTQTRDSQIVLSGTTTVKNVVLEETTKVTPDTDFKGKVDKIEVQSTTKGEVVISVPAKEVTTRTFATVDIQAPVDKLAINTNTTVNINADIKEVTINKFAEGTKVEVSKGNTVGTIETEVKVEVGGAGNVDKVTGAGKDESIVAPKPERPSTGGGSSGGGSNPTPPVTPTENEVEKFEKAFIAELNGNFKNAAKELEVTINLSDKESGHLIIGNYDNKELTAWEFLRATIFPSIKNVNVAYSKIKSVTITGLNEKTTGEMSIADLTTESTPSVENLTQWGGALFEEELEEEGTTLVSLKLEQIKNKSYSIDFELEDGKRSTFTVVMSTLSRDLNEKIDEAIKNLNKKDNCTIDFNAEERTITTTITNAETTETIGSHAGTGMVGIITELFSNGVTKFEFKFDKGNETVASDDVLVNKLVSILNKILEKDPELTISELAELPVTSLNEKAVEVKATYEHNDGKAEITFKFVFNVTAKDVVTETN